MGGVVSAVASAVVRAFAGIFTGTPDAQNPTVNAIEAYHHHQDEERRQRVEEAYRLRRDEEEDRRMREHEERRRREDDEDRERRWREDEERRLRDEEDQRVRDDHERMMREERDRVTREMEEIAASIRQQQDEIRAQEGAAKMKEEEVARMENAVAAMVVETREANERARAAEEASVQRGKEAMAVAAEARRKENEAVRRQEQFRLKEETRRHQEDEQRAVLQEQLEAATENLKKGIQPVVWPTRQQLNEAKVKFGYRKDMLHFAVSGPSGSGKSSLINAFRGLKTKSHDAAPVGIVETTTTITRYPDARQEMPYQRFVWYDVPGAGTIDMPSWQYFNQQGLFVFDFIILVYDARFTEIDADILENCRRFRIPAFIVRSKANQHILNMLYEDDDLTFLEAREKYIEETRQNLASNLKKRNLHDVNTRCYIVSNSSLYDLVKAAETADDSGKPPARKKNQDAYIDEEQLLVDLLDAAVKRRYHSANKTRDSRSHVAVRQTLTAATAAVGELASSVSKLGLGTSSGSSTVK
ncbi:interferon-inducible GTPase-domain-containing protein [Tricharina praecox]|uniref:interferon-inducible GTPase-domain-containing protein n=1 Tax=Tricharina praecox TaxID=43433 RepID=UPI00221F18C8|nr:interferon-inducible GTPase-domain-containing protein [Tricharina praecox]KAI5855525.1 interferon-inducible GTPase-domain-containing protein [Tricharina praecox]